MKIMKKWISIISEYLNKFLELGVLLLAVSVIAEILFGPNVAFFGTKVTSNLIDLLNNLGDQGIAALIVIFAILFEAIRIVFKGGKYYSRKKKPQDTISFEGSF